MTAAFAAGTPEFPSVAAPKKQKHHGTLKIGLLNFHKEMNLIVISLSMRQTLWLLAYCPVLRKTAQRALCSWSVTRYKSAILGRKQRTEAKQRQNLNFCYTRALSST